MLGESLRDYPAITVNIQLILAVVPSTFSLFRSLSLSLSLPLFIPLSFVFFSLSALWRAIPLYFLVSFSPTCAPAFPSRSWVRPKRILGAIYLVWKLLSRIWTIETAKLDDNNLQRASGTSGLREKGRAPFARSKS